MSDREGRTSRRNLPPTLTQIADRSVRVPKLARLPVAGNTANTVVMFRDKLAFESHDCRWGQGSVPFPRISNPMRVYEKIPYHAWRISLVGKSHVRSLGMYGM
jgi:hypothetical protein